MALLAFSQPSARIKPCHSRDFPPFEQHHPMGYHFHPPVIARGAHKRIRELLGE
jgi:hypothetical protein